MQIWGRKKKSLLKNKNKKFAQKKKKKRKETVAHSHGCTQHLVTKIDPHKAKIARAFFK